MQVIKVLVWAPVLMLLFSLSSVSIPIRAQQARTDLAINLNDWWFEDDGRTLIFFVTVTNQGRAPAGETQIQISTEWELFSHKVLALQVAEEREKYLDVSIPNDLRDTTQIFVLTLDPENRVLDYDPQNNRLELEITLLPLSLAVNTIEPRQIKPGQQLDLNISGQGFEDGLTVMISGEDIGIEEVIFHTPEHLAVIIAVDNQAQAGPRTLEIINPNGQFVTVDQAFEVTLLESSSGLSLGGIFFYLFAAGVVFFVGLKIWQQIVPPRFNNWEELKAEASTDDPPEGECSPGTRWVKKTFTLILGRKKWQLDTLYVALYDAQTGLLSQWYTATDDIVKQINRLLQLPPRKRTEQNIPQMPVTFTLADQIMTWQQAERETGCQDAWMRTDFKGKSGSQAKIKLELYQCTGTPGNTEWQKIAETSLTSKERDAYFEGFANIFGPRPHEMPPAYKQRVRDKVAQFLYQLSKKIA